MVRRAEKGSLGGSRSLCIGKVQEAARADARYTVLQMASAVFAARLTFRERLTLHVYSSSAGLLVGVSWYLTPSAVKDVDDGHHSKVDARLSRVGMRDSRAES